MEFKIPTLSEIVRYNEDFSRVRIDWEKFISLESLSKKNDTEIKTKARRYLGYYLFYLTNNNFLEKLDENSFVIVEKSKVSKNKDHILNPKIKDILYGFSRKEDAYQYSDIAYPKINGNLTIDRYKEIFEGEN